MFYLLIYIVILFLSFISYYAKNKSEISLSNFFYYSIIFCLLIVGGFRYETGGDWPGYKQIYDEFLLGNQSRSIEPLFLFLVKIANLFGSYQYIFLFCEIIRFATLATILNTQLKRNRKYKCIFILLYFSMYYFYYDFVIIRQSTAAAIIAWGLLRNKSIRFRKYFFCVVLAACFHYSALIMMFFYLPLFKFKQKNTTIISFLVIFCYFLGVDLVGTLIITILKFLPRNYLLQRLYAYAIQSDLASSRILTGQSFVYLAIYIATIFLKYYKHREYDNIIYNGVMFYIFFYLGFPSMSTLSTRLSTFFSIFMIFAIIEIIDHYKKTVIIPVGIVALCFCFYKGVYFNAPTHVAYNPYHFYPYYAVTGKSTDGAERLNKVDAISIKMREKK